MIGFKRKRKKEIYKILYSAMKQIKMMCKKIYLYLSNDRSTLTLLQINYS